MTEITATLLPKEGNKCSVAEERGVKRPQNKNAKFCNMKPLKPGGHLPLKIRGGALLFLKTHK